MKKDPFLVAMGKRIRATRELVWISQYDVATKVGITRAMLSHIETARCWPSMKALSAVSLALGVKVRDLIPEGM